MGMAEEALPQEKPDDHGLDRWLRARPPSGTFIVRDDELVRSGLGPLTSPHSRRLDDSG
jgi:hypothetical protein